MRKNDKPIIAHVRAASVGTEVNKENAHPFETKDFILAHNGTLEFRKKEIKEEWDKMCEEDETLKDKIDSEKFIIFLQKRYDESKNKKFCEVIKGVANEFYGKFAFMIYAKQEDIYYIIRGRSATLHACQILKDKNRKVKYIEVFSCRIPIFVESFLSAD